MTSTDSLRARKPVVLYLGKRFSMRDTTPTRPFGTPCGLITDQGAAHTTQLTILVSKTDQGCGWPFCLSMVKADPAVQTHSKKRSGQTEPLETHQSIAIHARLRPLVCHRAPERPALAPASLHLLISRQFPSAPMAPKRPDSTLDVRKKCGTASQERRWTLSSRAGHNYAKLL